MNRIPFCKMQGAGNDFVVLDNRELCLTPDHFPALARRVCSRRLSVGADGLMVADLPQHGGDLKLWFYNADGSMAEMCGNGARCIGRYGYERFAQKSPVVIETTSGDVLAWHIDDRQVRIRLNEPTVLEAHRPAAALGDVHDCAYVELGEPGLPHAVLVCPDLAQLDYEAKLLGLGAALRSAAEFAKGANMNFCQVLTPNDVVVRTFERGVEGFTLACGTGSASTVVGLQTRGLVQKNGPVQVHNPGGILTVEAVWQGDAVTELYLTGPTNMVSQGFISDEDLVL